MNKREILIAKLSLRKERAQALQISRQANHPHSNCLSPRSRHKAQIFYAQQNRSFIYF